MLPNKDKEQESTSDSISTTSSDPQQENLTGVESLSSSDLFTSSDNEETEVVSNFSYRRSFAGKTLPENRKPVCVDQDDDLPATSGNTTSTSSGESDKEQSIENEDPVAKFSYSETSVLSSNNIEEVTDTDSPIKNDQAKMLNNSCSEILSEIAEEEKGIHGLRLPLARVRKIMKADPYLGIASQDAVFLVAKATELFIESLASEAYEITVSSKKKTVSRKDIDTIIEKIEALVFLEGAID